jgi:glycosyltransferase involved in cell wall biosynthesis
MNKLPISICMISGPEAARIGRALASVAPWASEIVVVLNEDVRDDTEKIAASFGAKIFREPWKGHIAQKNSAAEKASQAWLLGLDADEEVSAPLKDEIARMFGDARELERYVAFSMPRCSFYCGRWIRHGDWYPDRKVRLWKRGQARWAGIDPHDKLKVDGPVGKLAAELLHYSNQSINQQISKIAPYSDDFVRHCLERDRRVSWFDLAVRPGWRFVRSYFLRLGFLDGWPGYYIAWLSAFSTLTRYVKLQEARLCRQTAS